MEDYSPAPTGDRWTALRANRPDDRGQKLSTKIKWHSIGAAPPSKRTLSILISVHQPYSAIGLKSCAIQFQTVVFLTS